MEKVKMDKCPNILIGGDFNAIKESDYSEEEKTALKKFYSTFTDNPFKEIEFLMGKGFRDCANRHSSLRRRIAQFLRGNHVRLRDVVWRTMETLARH